MALDSQSKRMAAAGTGRVWMRSTLADSVSAEQRSSIGISYPVALFSDAPVVVPTPEPTPPEISKGASGWSSKEWAKQKSRKNKIIKDDEELLLIITQSTEALKKFYL